MAEGHGLSEIHGLVGLARGQFQVSASGGAEDLQEKIAQPFRWRDGSLQDLADLLFYGHPIPDRAVSKPSCPLPYARCLA